MKNKILLPLLLSGLFFAGCVTNPVTNKKQLMLVSSSQELEIGKQYAPEIEKQLYGRLDNKGIQDYVDSVGQKIAKVSHMPNLKFSYVVVNHDMTNAMALPGGYVIITRGMLEKLTNESQLAAILAHETVHVTARHSAAAMSQQIGIDLLLSVALKDGTGQGVATAAKMGTQLIGLKYSRMNEIEADQYGMDYMAKAGYNPKGMIETMEILEAESKSGTIEFFSTHPNPANRKELLNAHLNRQGYTHRLQGLTVGADEYQAKVISPMKTIPQVKRPLEQQKQDK